MLYVLTFVLFFLVTASVHAVREQHLVVLRWPTGTFFLVRGSDGRYTLFHPLRLPLVVTRFGVVSVASRGVAAARRLRTPAARRPVALGVRH